MIDRSGVGAGDAAASPSKFFRQIWKKVRPIWTRFAQFRVKFGYTG